MRVAVIGGGIAGLAAAHALLRRGHAPVVFEAAPRVGGKMGSVAERGYLSENGPNFLARPLEALLDAAGLRGEVVQAGGAKTRWVHLDGRVLAAPSLGLLLRTGAMRALVEPLVARPVREDAPLLDVLRARLGAKAGTLVAQLLASGVYAGDPAALSAREAFPALGARLARGSLFRSAGTRGAVPIWSLRRGLGSLPEALAQRLEVRVRRAVAALQPGWRVDGEQFDGVVLAVPAGAAAALLEPVAAEAARALRALPVAPVAVMHLGVPADGVPRGFGVLDPAARLHALGTLLPSSMLPGRAPPGFALLTSIVGGARNPDHAALSDDALVAAVRADLRETLRVTAAPDYVRIVRWPDGIPQVTVGHRARIAAIRALLPPRLFLCGAAYDGVSVPDSASSGESTATHFGDTYRNSR